VVVGSGKNTTCARPATKGGIFLFESAVTH
jgi:hypothetical protein